MKKEIPLLTRYFWWPLVSVTDWIGAFINQCPGEKKWFQSPRIQNHPWPKKIREMRKHIHASPGAKGAPHAETKIYNHPRK